MSRVIRIAIVSAMFLLVLPGAGKAEPLRNTGQWRVMELPTTGNWFEGRTGYSSGSPLSRGSALEKGYYSIYLLNLNPGSSYTLGLRYSSDVRNKPSVLLYDRWPLDPKARRYKLPMGPVVRTNPGKIEYRWRLGVSGRSQGDLAFIVVAAHSGLTGAKGPFRHFMYLTTPAVQPKNRFGTGITYLRGPSDLLLPQSRGVVEYIIEYPYRDADSDNYRLENRRSGDDLINNGDFSRGLRGWEMFSERGESFAADHMAFGREGLRIWSGEEAVPSGVRQAIQRDVQDAGSLVLGVELRIDQDPKASLHTDVPTLELTICYLDAEGKDHCGGEAYRAGFTAHRPAPRANGTIQVNIGKWFFFQDELMNLDPEPQVIRSVTLAGGQSPGQEVRIRYVHLTEGSGNK